MIALDDVKNVYFIGVGGIGMSALARFFNKKGIKVSGYDKTETALTKKLVMEGIDIHYNDTVALVPKDLDLVVFTPAVPKDLKELTYVRSLGIPVEKRAKVLGMISNSQKSIAIAGTHGKTTTSGMLSHVLKSSGMDISAFLGGVLTGYETNYFLGSNEWVVLEADEYDRSFLHLNPKITVINSVDADHLDIYGAHDKMLNTFDEFVHRTSRDGIVLIAERAADDMGLKRIEKLKSKFKVLVFGFEKESDVRATNIDIVEEKTRFDLEGLTGYDKSFALRMPGRHNISNAMVSLIVSHYMGIDLENARKGLASFEGIKRRFEWITEGERVYIDDYAHHPSEIDAAYQAVRSIYPSKKLLVIFQPHLYSRTKDFAEGFAKSLDRFDRVVLMDVYPARELPIEGVESEMIATLMANDNVSVLNEKEILEEVKNKNYEVLMTLGAGDIDLLVPKIKGILETND